MNSVDQNKITKWLHINELLGDPWVKPIYIAMRNAKNNNLVGLSDNICERGLAITTRLNMLPKIIQRIEAEAQKIYQIIAQYKEKKEYISTEVREGYAVDVDVDLKYHFLIDVDSLLFELNSVNELMRDFIIDVYKYAGRSLDQEGFVKEVKKILKQAGKSIKWFIDLDNHRNFFIHTGAPLTGDRH